MSHDSTLLLTGFGVLGLAWMISLIIFLTQESKDDSGIRRVSFWRSNAVTAALVLVYRLLVLIISFARWNELNEVSFLLQVLILGFVSTSLIISVVAWRTARPTDSGTAV